MKKILAIIALLIIFTAPVQAQQNVDEQVEAIESMGLTAEDEQAAVEYIEENGAIEADNVGDIPDLSDEGADQIMDDASID
jgi:opacity protein-like surface antigen